MDDDEPNVVLGIEYSQSYALFVERGGRYSGPWKSLFLKLSGFPLSEILCRRMHWTHARGLVF